jgi:hypothetical protein
MSTVHAVGTIFEYGNTADHSTATTWTAVGRVVSIKPPMRKSKDINVTVLTSTAEEKEPGLPGTSETSLKLQYGPTLAGTLDGFFNVVKAYRVHYPDGSGRKFNGWISELGEAEIKNGEVIEQEAKVTITALDVFQSTLS